MYFPFLPLRYFAPSLLRSQCFSTHRSDRNVLWSVVWIVAWSDCTVARSDRNVALSGDRVDRRDRSFGWSVAQNALSIVWNDRLVAQSE